MKGHGLKTGHGFRRGSKGGDACTADSTNPHCGKGLRGWWQPAKIRRKSRKSKTRYTLTIITHALYYLYSSTNITRMTTSENVGCLRYVEKQDIFKVWATKLKATVSNILTSKD